MFRHHITLFNPRRAGKFIVEKFIVEGYLGIMQMIKILSKEQCTGIPWVVLISWYVVVPLDIFLREDFAGLPHISDGQDVFHCLWDNFGKPLRPHPASSLSVFAWVFELTFLQYIDLLIWIHTISRKVCLLVLYQCRLSQRITTEFGKVVEMHPKVIHEQATTIKTWIYMYADQIFSAVRLVTYNLQ